MAAGGARPGAGRKRSEDRAVKQDEIVVRKLKGGAKLGWEVLADEYQSLIRLAIEIAKGEDSKPDRSMLKTLLELLPRVVGTESDDSNVIITGVLGDIRAIIHEAKSNG